MNPQPTPSGEVLVREVNHTFRSGLVGQNHITALSGVSVQIRPGVITGLLGPNGSGKSTLMQVIAGFLPLQTGTVLIDGNEILNNTVAAQTVHLAREGGDFGGMPVRNLLAFHQICRQSWDADFAAHLIDRFNIPPKRSAEKLSRGQRSALAATIALASRAPVTILDEVQLGMDVPTRMALAEEILADYAARPRTYLISSHLVSELETLLEDVVIIKGGQIIESTTADEIRSRLHTLIGPAPAIAQAITTANLRVLAQRDLGNTSQITTDTALDPAALAAWSTQGVELGTVPLQEAFLHLTNCNTPGIKGVYQGKIPAPAFFGNEE